MTSEPQWIEYVGRGSGRDHLGLQSVGQASLEYVTSGYSNITQRLRYYSLYSWITQQFFRSNLEKTYKNYRIFLKKMALLYAVSCGISHTDESITGIDGIDFVRANIGKDVKSTDAINIKKLLQDYNDNHWIYKAKLNDIFLTHHNDESGIPALVEPYGKNLAEAFDSAISSLNPQSINLESVRVSTLNELEKNWCFHHLDKNQDELKILEDLLFNRNNDLGIKATNRRYSLILFLLHIKECGNLDMHEFELWLESNVALPTELERVRRLWQIVYIRNRQVFASESLFYYFLSICRDRLISQSEIEIQLKNSLEENSHQDQYSELILKHWSQPIDTLLTKLKSRSSENIEFTEAYIIRPLVLIHYSERSSKEIEHLSRGFLQLLAIYQRINHHKSTTEEHEQLNLGSKERQSLNNHLQTIDSYLSLNLSTKDVITKLITDRILARHQLVAAEKLFDRGQNTFHYTYDENHYVINPIAEGFAPQYNFMKFNQATQFFQDLGLVQMDDAKNYTITPEGNSIIQEFYE